MDWREEVDAWGELSELWELCDEVGQSKCAGLPILTSLAFLLVCLSFCFVNCHRRS